MQTFDMVVIGTGAGEYASSAGANAGMKVALIDEGPYGGTCVNRGCIPSKMLIRSADVYELVQRAHLWGVNAEVRSIDWQKIVSQVFTTVDGWSADDLERNEENPNITNFIGHAEFVGEKTLAIRDEEIRGDIVVIAAGSRPRVPNIPGLADTPFVTTDEAMRMPQQPRRLAIVGGGFIGAEMAHFFGNLGTEVTLIQRSGRLIGNEDAEVAAKFTEISGRKFNVMLNTELKRVQHSDGTFDLGLSREGSMQDLTCDALLIATGRQSNADRLKVEATGVKTDERGFIVADEYLETNVKGIWTLGDIAGRFMLRHSANYEAAYVAHNALHPDDKVAVDYHAMPHAVFGSPQVAGVGMTEEQARQPGRKIKVGRAAYLDVTYGIALRDEDGFVKVITDVGTGEILGCHILGTDASILIQEAVNAMRTHVSIGDLNRSIYIHPALPEVMSKAFENAEP
ncbi:MAG TPA: FAD-dependent oxidoreductase [Dehalococcoidia bacterium]|nr:FAD-dependent oxidoreductase [Dehalococcoidia bacterium]